MRKRISLTRLHDLLIEAAETERRLPPANRKQLTGCWPDYLPEWLSYADQTTQNTLGKATSRQGTNYDFNLNSIADMKDTDDRKLLWATAHSGAFKNRGASWVKLAKIQHCDRRTVKARYQDALIRLYYVVSQNTRYSKIVVAE